MIDASERLKNIGRLQEYKLEVNRLQLRIESLRDSVRDCLDPFELVRDLKTDHAAQQSIELAGLMLDYKEMLAKIQAIEKVLGIKHD